MRFTVTWHPAAADELAALWLESSDRTPLTDAANTIDSVLAEEPATKGEEFYGDRLLVVAPLAVTFTVRAEDQVVEILQVWQG
ncbi:MAG: hypothetical protein AAGA92_15940 [Planctomycetota bacterium]